MIFKLGVVILAVSSGAACHAYNTQPLAGSHHARQESTTNTPSTRVDLGYAIYEGFVNDTTGLNTWLGIRFAAPPTGANRWQKPQTPLDDEDRSVIQADTYAPICYQSPNAGNMVEPVDQSLASEDCLFVNVFSPSNATGLLPVFVYIHGGGWGRGNGRQDLSALINTNNNGFIGVTIQYRLGAFGFLSSDEVYRFGSPNAGIYDQNLALRWVQKYISLFNGDPTQVTIGGQSAGGGSVMIHDTAYGGALGPSLFRNIFAASPYLPRRYSYNDWIPSQSYYAFASQVGCPPSLPYGRSPQTIFECLQAVDADVVANASATLSQSVTFGTWAFLPVIDNAIIPGLPSQALLGKHVNGLNALIGNNANEGPRYTPQDITSEEDLFAWLNVTFPLFSPSDFAKLLRYYPTSDSGTTGTNFSTNGFSAPTALDQSSVATGLQQRAYNIYAEATFVCPSYWMAEAYSSDSHSPTQRRAYKYQYSVPPGLHGDDNRAYFLPAGSPNVGPDMSLAFKTLLGNFIMTSNPSIPLSVAVGSTPSGDNTSTSTQGQVGAGGPQAITNWPPYTVSQPYQINLNQTGGTPHAVPFNDTVNTTEFWPPGTRNSIGLYDAYSWEGGRGMRCDFFRSVAGIMPQ